MTSSFTTLLPNHLSHDQPQGLKQHEPIAQYEIGDFRNFIYLILDWETHQAAIVDPQADLSEPLKALKENGFTLTTVLLTHSHHDHIAGIPELARKLPPLPIYLHSNDMFRLKDLREQDRLKFLADQDQIRVGNLNITALHTPGHSAGALSYFLSLPRPYLFTGDTIFIRDCGRTDLPTGSNEEMFASIQKIKRLPPETIFLPGHHYARECATTLETELKESPPFCCKTVDELKALP